MEKSPIKQLNKLALDKVINGTRQERKYLCGKDFSLFFTYYYLSYVKYPYAPFHFDMFQDVHDLMNGKFREVAWIMFRESAKTSLAKGFVTWLITYKKRTYLNIDSFDKENAERVLFDVVLDLQTNPKIKSDFGELFNAKKSADEITQKRVNNFLTNNGVRVEAHSTQESVRGRLHGHQRPDFILLDDFETNKTKDSEAHTKQIVSHIDEFKSGIDSNGIILYLGNYITEHGSINKLIERAKTDPRLKVRMKAVIENDQPTWPAKYALTDTEASQTGKVSLEDKRKQLGSQVFNAEMMNQPIDEESQEFFKHWFKYTTLEDVLKQQVRKFATIDSALTRNAKSDFTGITKNYVNEKNEWHISARQYKINSKELVNIIFQLHADGFEVIGIEEGAFTEAVEPFFNDECTIRNKYPHIVKLKHGGVMKETRIRGLIPRYEQGKIYHIEGECDELESQLLRFPHSIHDDIMDSEQYQNKVAEPPYPQRHIESEEVKPLYDSIGI